MNRFFMFAAAAGLALAAAVSPASAHGWRQFGWGWPPVYIAPVPWQPAPYLYAPYVMAPYQSPLYMAASPVPDPTIRYVQDGLNRLGFGPLNVDGVAGPATANAIANFQANNGLSSDGLAGSATIAVLNKQLGLPPLPYPPPPPPVAQVPPPVPGS